VTKHTSKRKVYDRKGRYPGVVECKSEMEFECERVERVQET
jgi:hypothetical protein